MSSVSMIGSRIRSPAVLLLLLFEEEEEVVVVVEEDVVVDEVVAAFGTPEPEFPLLPGKDSLELYCLEARPKRPEPRRGREKETGRETLEGAGTSSDRDDDMDMDEEDL